jgi:DNA-binding MltR family transcriptional regulator
MSKKRVENKTPEEIGEEIIAAMDRDFHEEPDRIIAIVGAAYLDSMIDSLLRAVFIDVPAETESLLRPDAPLGSNGSRCQLAYCLGLITKDQRDDLRIIAKIRNYFAHDFNAQEFNVSPIRDLCTALKQPGLLAAMPEKLFSADNAKLVTEYVHDITNTPREQFRMSVISLFGSLLRRIAYIRRADAASWFTYDPDALTGPSSQDNNA